jgi:hypothetical protein
MIGYVCGSMIFGSSGYLVVNSIKLQNELHEKKNKLKENVISFDKFEDMKDNDKCIVFINNTLQAGILNILEQKIKTSNVIIDLNYKIHKKNEEHWEKLFSKKLNLNFGKHKFYPPLNNSDILYTSHDIIRMTSMYSSTMTSLLKKTYNLDISLPQHKNYAAQFISFEDKTVYAFGEKINNDKFYAQIMGTNFDQVANKVYEPDMNIIDLKLMIGVSGIALGLFTIFTS